MRGKVSALVFPAAPSRITPAYAGKRQIDTLREQGNGDHPRLCGEKKESRLQSCLHLGSPPPMRGKEQKAVASPPFVGITPAYAGKSSGGFRVTLRLGDHPRLCGEKPGRALTVSTMLGSPPPMRGKAAVFQKCRHPVRITPAYAGKSCNHFCFSFVCQDHPRLCGEKHSTDGCFPAVYGSPPPMRGKASTSSLKSAASGITPAYAGKSHTSLTPRFCPWDHPRLCGEKKIPIAKCPHCGGSPPPMRGKDTLGKWLNCGLRITPAYAGKSPP